ncbi:hypothetical protein VP1G_11198 [Cytospora mali]|uniref:Uncharacterized protein n=1 Tax=Cytospora mali TaxID=578113 RepID=A0A194VBD1_CYTMA|nr:hypothetical protein VP1G_11198 [Valsa mali var. pyri (nom. inval.)]
MSLYYSEKHYHPRRHSPPPVMMLVRRTKSRETHKPPSTTTATPPARKPPTVATGQATNDESVEKVSQPPCQIWSKWEPIQYSQWEGHWRARARPDGGWIYQFTKDFITIFEQCPTEIASPTQSQSWSTASTTASESVLSGEAVALATTSCASSQSRPSEAPPPSISADRCVCNCALCYHAAWLALSYALTTTGSRDSKDKSTTAEVASTEAAVAPTTTMEAQEGSCNHGHSQYHGASAAASRTMKSDGHGPHGSAPTRAVHHSHQSNKTSRRPKKIGEIVRADKKKKNDPKTIVDRWNWEWDGSA